MLEDGAFCVFSDVYERRNVLATWDESCVLMNSKMIFCGLGFEGWPAYFHQCEPSLPE